MEYFTKNRQHTDNRSPVVSVDYLVVPGNIGRMMVLVMGVSDGVSDGVSGGVSDGVGVGVSDGGGGGVGGGD